MLLGILYAGGCCFINYKIAQKYDGNPLIAVILGLLLGLVGVAIYLSFMRSERLHTLFKSSGVICDGFGDLVSENQISHFSPIALKESDSFKCSWGDDVNRSPYLKINNELISNKEVKIKNNVFTIVGSLKKWPIELSLYKEGCLVKYRGKLYLTPFNESTECLIENRYEKVDIDYHFEPIQAIQTLLSGDYFYYYKSTLVSSGTKHDVDTRHYTKSGELDKRYSKQNQHTGGTHHYESYTYKEDFYQQANFSVSLILGMIDLCMILDIEGANNLLEALSVSLGKCQSNVSSVAKDPTDFYVVHFLTGDDRESIRNFLCGPMLKDDEGDSESGNLIVNGRPASEQEKLDFKARMREFKSHMGEFTRKNEARKLIENILKQRRNDLEGL